MTGQEVAETSSVALLFHGVGVYRVIFPVLAASVSVSFADPPAVVGPAKP